MIRHLALRIRQYAYYAIFSQQLSAVEMTRRIGVQPDETRVRDTTSKRGPRCHSWKLTSDDMGPDVDLSVQIEALIARLRPYRSQILEVVEAIREHEADVRGTGHVFRIVRHLDDDDGELDGYQHRLLGWSIAAESVRLLADLDVAISADEYGQEFSWWQWRQKRRYYAPIAPDPRSEIIDTGWRIDRYGCKPNLSRTATDRAGPASKGVQ